MGIDTTVIPENLLRYMSEKDRLALGKSGLTQDDHQNNLDAVNERSLQSDIRQELNRRGIHFINPPMSERVKGMPIGSPDFHLCYKGVPLAFECKCGRNQQSTEQHDMEAKMTDSVNGWRYFVITDLAQVRAILAAVDF